MERFWNSVELVGKIVGGLLCVIYILVFIIPLSVLLIVSVFPQSSQIALLSALAKMGRIAMEESDLGLFTPLIVVFLSTPGIVVFWNKRLINLVGLFSSITDSLIFALMTIFEDNTAPAYPFWVFFLFSYSFLSIVFIHRLKLSQSS